MSLPLASRAPSLFFRFSSSTRVFLRVLCPLVPLLLFCDLSRILKRRSHRIITHARFEPPSRSRSFATPTAPSSLLLARPRSVILLFFLVACVSSRYRLLPHFLPRLSFSFPLNLLHILLFLFYFLPRYSPSCIGQLHVVNKWRYFDSIWRDCEIMFLVTHFPSFSLLRACWSNLLGPPPRLSWDLISAMLQGLDCLKHCMT